MFLFSYRIKGSFENVIKVGVLSQFSGRDNLGNVVIVEQYILIQDIFQLQGNEKNYSIIRYLNSTAYKFLAFTRKWE